MNREDEHYKQACGFKKTNESVHKVDLTSRTLRSAQNMISMFLPQMEYLKYRVTVLKNAGLYLKQTTMRIQGVISSSNFCQKSSNYFGVLPQREFSQREFLQCLLIMLLSEIFLRFSESISFLPLALRSLPTLTPTPHPPSFF